MPPAFDRGRAGLARAGSGALRSRHGSVRCPVRISRVTSGVVVGFVYVPVWFLRESMLPVPCSAEGRDGVSDTTRQHGLDSVLEHLVCSSPWMARFVYVLWCISRGDILAASCVKIRLYNSVCFDPIKYMTGPSLLV